MLAPWALPDSDSMDEIQYSESCIRRHQNEERKNLDRRTENFTLWAVSKKTDVILRMAEIENAGDVALRCLFTDNEDQD